MCVDTIFSEFSLVLARDKMYNDDLCIVFMHYIEVSSVKESSLFIPTGRMSLLISCCLIMKNWIVIAKIKINYFERGRLSFVDGTRDVLRSCCSCIRENLDNYLTLTTWRLESRPVSVKSLPRYVQS